MEEILDSHSMLVFASQPAEINGYVVCLIAAVHRDQYNRYPHLDGSVYQQNGRSPSFVWGAVEVVLADAAEELRKRNAGALLEWRQRDTRELLRIAGTFFTRDQAWAGTRFSPRDTLLHGTYDLFDAATVISSMR
ncbi:MAG: hypothetical protein HUU20_00720 [Pirellulales bacterium]|nr:hypothetical protein [Pirellulales bacterium]